MIRRRWYAAPVLVGALYGCAHPPPDVGTGDAGTLAPVDDVPASSTTPTVPAPGEGAWAALPARADVADAVAAATTTTLPPPPPTTVPSAPTTTTPPSTPPPSAPPAPSGSVWDRLAACESGGDWHINTGNGHYGGLQFTLQSWRGVGGTGYPHEHTREEQIARAEQLLAVQGWGAWPGCARQLGLR